MRIGIDAMGSDFSPHNEIEGILLAYNSFSEDQQHDIELILYGDIEEINNVAQKNKLEISHIQCVHSPQKVEMNDEPTEILKTKRESSLYLGLQDLKDGKIDAFLSAGNTGAMLTCSSVLLGRIKGVSRPTIATLMPSVSSRPVVLLDVGATVDHKARFLYEFAIMGSIYAKFALNIEEPKVALLNIGEEPTKGTDELREAYKMLEKSKVNFIGNIEGNEMMMGKSDVIVCDGFVGNVILKFAEGFIPFFKSKLKSYGESKITNKLKLSMALPAFKNILKELDYEEYGGVPVLGVKGISIVGHGKSTPIAIKNMIKKAKELVDNKLANKIEESIILNTINS
jgi:glycerol-3-phosphate acyltransferase PlsX